MAGPKSPKRSWWELRTAVEDRGHCWGDSSKVSLQNRRRFSLSSCLPRVPAGRNPTWSHRLRCVEDRIGVRGHSSIIASAFITFLFWQNTQWNPLKEKRGSGSQFKGLSVYCGRESMSAEVAGTTELGARFAYFQVNQEARQLLLKWGRALTYMTRPYKLPTFSC